MRRLILGLLGTLTLSLTLASGAHAAAQSWQEGTHFDRLPAVQRTTVPAGKVEVLQVFSFGARAATSSSP